MPPEKEQELSEFENPYVGGEKATDEDDSTVDRGDSLDPPKPSEETTEDETKPEDLEKEGGEEETTDEESEEESTDEESEEESTDEESEEKSEEESEEESTDESADTDGKDEKDEKPRQQNRIPKDRFDKVNERMKRAEARLREIEEREAKEKEAAEVEEFDFDAKEDEYQDAVLDGDKEKARAIRAEIRAAEKAMYEAAAESKATQSKAATKLELQIESSVLDMQKRFAALDENDEAYDQDVVDEILALQKGYIASGYSPVDALEKGRDMVVKMYDLEERGSAETAEESAETSDPRGDKHVEKPAKQPAKRTTDIKKNLKAAKAQPPKMETGESGANDRSNETSDMSEEEFDALPESKKRQLRGDVL